MPTKWKDGVAPNPDSVFPIPGYEALTHIKPTIKNPNIIVGDFSYYSGVDYEKQVLHHYEFIVDKLIIGKFCQIAEGVEFIMNGANHQMNAVSTFPFYTHQGWSQPIPPLSQMPIKGDTIVGNDVWIGEKLGRAGVGRFLCRCPAKVKPPPLDEEMAAKFICSRGAVLLVLFQIKRKGYRCRDFG